MSETVIQLAIKTQNDLLLMGISTSITKTLNIKIKESFEAISNMGVGGGGRERKLAKD